MYEFKDESKATDWQGQTKVMSPLEKETPEFILNDL